MHTHHLNLNTHARYRLAGLRQYAATGKWVRPMTWRDVRFAKFNTARGLWNGLNDNCPVWVSHETNNFRREKRADDICTRWDHKGWFTDNDQDATAWGIVVALPHGKFIASYHWSDNGESVYFPEIYSDADSAARAGDHHAEKFAEAEREQATKLDNARRIEDDIETKTARRVECLLLARINHARDAMREEARELRADIASMRETLAKLEC